MTFRILNRKEEIVMAVHDTDFCCVTGARRSGSDEPVDSVGGGSK